MAEPRGIPRVTDMTEPGAIQLEPIASVHVPEVGAFLHEHLNPRLSASEWARSIVPTWPAEAPNHGYLLRHDGRIIGVQLAFYSRRDIGGAKEDFCNLGAWCVLEP